MIEEINKKLTLFIKHNKTKTNNNKKMADVLAMSVLPLFTRHILIPFLVTTMQDAIVSAVVEWVPHVPMRSLVELGATVVKSTAQALWMLGSSAVSVAWANWSNKCR